MSDDNTFVELADSPGALAVPEETQSHQGDNLVFVKVLGLLEHKSPGFPGPFHHESVVFQSGLAILVPVDTRSLFHQQNFRQAGLDFLPYFAAHAQILSTTWGAAPPR